MKLYKFSKNTGAYLGSVDVSGDIVPSFHTTEAPPQASGSYAKMTNTGWVLISGTAPAEPLPNPLEQVLVFNIAQSEARAAAYAQEADPLFFMSQRGEATQEQWLAKIEEIKTRYPYQ